MNSIVIAPAFDSGGAHPADAHGAFQPGARAWAAHYGQPAPHLFDNRPVSLRVRFNQILDLIAHATPKIDTFVAFSHGLRRQLQWGLTVDNTQEFVVALAPVAAEKLTIILYACSAGEDKTEVGGHAYDDGPGAGDGSIADLLRDGFQAVHVDATVIAHTTVGDTRFNPYLRRFDKSQDGHGGVWVFSHKEDLFPRFSHRMHTTNLWMRAPYMTRDQIHAELLK